MTEGSRFPIYISIENDGEDPFPTFLRHVENATSTAKSKFGSAFADIERTVAAALDKPLTARGALDLDPARLKAAADGASRQAKALREVADAAQRLSAADPSLAFRRQAADTANAAAVAEAYSKSVAEQALALDRLQNELGQTRTATAGLASAQKGYQGSLAASRAASVGAGQQLQDLVISIGSGQRASTVLAQQLPQLAFAFSNVGGAVGNVARILSGPWGVAVAAGAFALGPLIDGLFKTGEAAEDVKFATDAMGEAQGILGNVLDITTGKIGNQSEALIALAKAQILVARVGAQTRAAEARRGVQGIQYRESQFSGGIGGGFSVSRRKIDARDTISQDVLSGKLGANAAIDRLENLRAIGRLTEEQFAAAATSVANLGVELQNVKVFGDAEKLLNGTGGRSLLKPGKTKKAKSGGRKGDGGAAQLKEFGEDTGSKIAAITDRFSDTPDAVARMNAALRQLDDIQSDIARRKPANIDVLLAQLSTARGLVKESLTKPFEDMVTASREQVEIDQRLIEGRELEAEALRRALAFRERSGPLTLAQAATVANIVVQEKLRSVEIERQTGLQRRQLTLIENTQSNVGETIGELLRGKGFEAIGNLFERQFDAYLEGLTDDLAESLFGDTFREQKLKLVGLDKVDEAGQVMARNVLATANTLARLKTAAGGAADALVKAAGNDNAIPSEATSGTPEIVVTGQRPITTRDLVRELGKQVLGERLASQIGATLQKAFQGAAIGQATSGVLKSIGIKQSNTAAKIGGALGNFIPGLPPGVGSAIGSIIGGTVGGLFKKTPRGNVEITEAAIKASGSKKLTGGLNTAGQGIQDRIAAIAESLGGNVGSYSASIRQKKDNFYVGGQKFGDIESAGKEALRQAIVNGAVQGITAGAQRLLAAGTDLDRQLSKAVKFQSIFDRLKEAEDPAGFALEKLNREFSSLKSIAQEAGEGLVELERLYGLERAKVIEETTERLSGTLKALIADLKTGDNGLSLRDRLSNARATFDPLANTIRNGGTVNADKFAEIARTVIDLQRQIDGSQTGYFDVFNDILGLSDKALGRERALLLAAGNTGSPFTSQVPSNDNVVGALNSMNDNLGQILTGNIAPILSAINANIGRIGNTGTVQPSNGGYQLGGNSYF